MMSEVVGCTSNESPEHEDIETKAFLDSEEDYQHLRMLEALLFAASEPLDEKTLKQRLPDSANLRYLLKTLKKTYEKRGVNIIKVAEKWTFRTASDLHFLLQEHRQNIRRLSRAALETLAIIAYHQPITRAEIEDVRGVSLSKGTLDMLLEIRWIRMVGRRRVPGRPITYGTSDAFLEHFGLENSKDLPGVDELRAAGLLESEPVVSVVENKTLKDDEGVETGEIENTIGFEDEIITPGDKGSFW